MSRFQLVILIFRGGLAHRPTFASCASSLFAPDPVVARGALCEANVAVRDTAAHGSHSRGQPQRGGVDMSLAPGHHLLPHERWFASSMLRRQSTHRTQAILRLEQNYGPAGMALTAAGMITAIPGQVVVISGILMLALGGDGALETFGFRLGGLGIAMILFGMIRYFQARTAGRVFRGDRPFVRR